MWSGQFCETPLRDVRYTIRQLRSAPVFAIVIYVSYPRLYTFSSTSAMLPRSPRMTTAIRNRIQAVDPSQAAAAIACYR
jgi:hypothetical protein